MYLLAIQKTRKGVEDKYSVFILFLPYVWEQIFGVFLKTKNKYIAN